ncbi:hypothetical protein EDB87DRAFT_1627063 [Lactarius vividus]|nr:hypothetical protein EDB87DRAFT_1627063 [Lactarius vividus]
MVAGDIPGNSATFDHLAAAPVAAAAPMSAPPFAANTDYINDFLFDLIIPQEWGSTFSLTPGMSPPHVFHNILYSSVQSADRCQFGHIAAERQHWGPTNTLPHRRGSSYVLLQAPSSANTLSNYDFTSVFQPDQTACTLPSWPTGDGIDFAGQAQQGFASISDLVNTYGNTHIGANLDMATPIDVSSAMETTRTEGVGVSETVLGKRPRKRYGAYRNRSAGLLTTAIAMNYPSRG